MCDLRCRDSQDSGACHINISVWHMKVQCTHIKDLNYFKWSALVPSLISLWMGVFWEFQSPPGLGGLLSSSLQHRQQLKHPSLSFRYFVILMIASSISANRAGNYTGTESSHGQSCCPGFKAIGIVLYSRSSRALRNGTHSADHEQDGKAFKTHFPLRKILPIF